MTDVVQTPQTLRYALGMAKKDLARRLLLLGVHPSVAAYVGVIMRRGGIAVLVFRLLDYTYSRGWKLVTKLGHLLLFYVSTVEIHSGARIGPGLVLPDIGGIGIPAFCEIGCNCTFLGPALLTVGGMEGIDLDKDRIVLGDYCVIGNNVRIIGAITLGNGTQVKPGSVVMTSFAKDGYLLSGMPSRRRAVLSLDDIRRWNPFLGRFMEEKKLVSGDG